MDIAKLFTNKTFLLELINVINRVLNKNINKIVDERVEKRINQLLLEINKKNNLLTNKPNTQQTQNNNQLNKKQFQPGDIKGKYKSMLEDTYFNNPQANQIDEGMGEYVNQEQYGYNTQPDSFNEPMPDFMKNILNKDYSTFAENHAMEPALKIKGNL